MSTLSVDTITGQTVAGNVKMPAGHVIQLKSMSSNADNSYTSSSYTNTAFTLSITPKYNTSKIYVMWFAEVTVQGDTNFHLRLDRGGTNIFTPFLGAGNFGSGNQHGHGYAFNYLDSPATTNSTTYTVQVAENSSGTIRIAGEAGGGSLTLMEIAQ